MTAFTYKAPSVKDVSFSGQYGNTAIWDAMLPIGGAIGVTSTTGDTITVDLIRLPAGTTVNQVSYVNTAYGAGTAIDVGFRYEDSSQTVPTGSAAVSATAFISAQSVATAGTGLKPIRPLHFSIPAIVTVKFSGATGEQIKKTVGELYLALQGKSDGA